jgi:hypothetical protein
MKYRAPSVEEVAFSLSRLPRFVGATLIPYTVGHHVLAGESLATDPLTRLAVLYHDIEEIATSDIPSPFKTQQQREQGDALRQWLFVDMLRISWPQPAVWAHVAKIDRMLLDAEAYTLLHPRARLDFESPDPVAVDAVWNVARWSPERVEQEITQRTRALQDTNVIRSMMRRAQ